MIAAIWMDEVGHQHRVPIRALKPDSRLRQLYSSCLCVMHYFRRAGAFQQLAKTCQISRHSILKLSNPPVFSAGQSQAPDSGLRGRVLTDIKVSKDLLLLPQALKSLLKLLRGFSRLECQCDPRFWPL